MRLSKFVLLSSSLLCIAPLFAKITVEDLNNMCKKDLSLEQNTIQNEEPEENLLEEATAAASQEQIEEKQQELLLSTSPSKEPRVENDELEENLLEEATAAAPQGQVEEQQQELFLSKSPSQEPCVEADQPYRINVSHIESKGIGYNQGYTSLEGFFTGKAGSYIPFFDARAHVFNNGKWATNLGIGTRYVIDPSLFMVGGNFYYDYRQTNHYHYNQIAIGLEAFLSRWELHANGYLPVGKKRKTLEHDLNWISFKAFSGHNILINENYTDKREHAMRGFNFEVGVHPFEWMKKYDFYVGAGPYYFNAHEGKTTWGVQARVKAEVSRYVYLELSNSYDHVFHDRFQGKLTLCYPFGVKGCYRNKKKVQNPQLADTIMYWRAVQPVERQEIVVTSKRKKTYTKDPIAIDPTTGQPFYVVFVNNTNTNPSPNGTFENPYAHLSSADGAHYIAPDAEDNAAPGNIIYVFAGNGTSSGMDQGNFAMQDSQRLLGSGNAHPFNTTKGLLIVPAQTTQFPHILSSAGHMNAAIFPLSNNEISGFDIQASGTIVTASSGISSSSSNLNVNVNNNNIIGGLNGIFFQDIGGNVTISNNTFSEHMNQAIVVEPNSGTCNALIESNVISLDTNGILVTNENSTLNALLINNVINNISGIGMILNQGPTSLPGTFIVRGNACSFLLTGVECTQENGTGAPSQFIIENNTVSNATSALSGAITVQNIGHSAVLPLCLRFNGNAAVSCAADFFISNPNVGAVLQLESGGVNNGLITTTGTITTVFPCTCGSGQGGDSCP